MERRKLFFCLFAVSAEYITCSATSSAAAFIVVSFFVPDLKFIQDRLHYKYERDKENKSRGNLT